MVDCGSGGGQGEKNSSGQGGNRQRNNWRNPFSFGLIQNAEEKEETRKMQGVRRKRGYGRGMLPSPLQREEGRNVRIETRKGGEERGERAHPAVPTWPS